MVFQHLAENYVNKVSLIREVSFNFCSSEMIKDNENNNGRRCGVLIPLTRIPHMKKINQISNKLQ